MALSWEERGCEISRSDWTIWLVDPLPPLYDARSLEDCTERMGLRLCQGMSHFVVIEQVQQNLLFVNKHAF